MTLSKEITLCTVLTPAHEMLFYLNVQLVRALNFGNRATWNVLRYDFDASELSGLSLPKVSQANTALLDGAERDSSDVRLTADELGQEVSVFPGPAREDVLRYIQKYTSAPRDLKLVSIEQRDRFYASCMHSLALERSLQSVSTRYVVFIDPDFLIFRPEWLVTVPAYLKEFGIAAFGAPWNPRWFHKPRRTLSPHFLVLDREKIQIQDGDLAPDWLAQDFVEPDSWRAFATSTNRYQRYKHLFTHARQAWSEDLAQRKAFGTRRESGHRLWERYPSVVKECLTPTFDPYLEKLVPDIHPPLFMLSRLDRFYPERLRYIPRHADSTYLGLGDMELPETRKLGWEEFCWRGNAFGTHIQCYTPLRRDGFISIKYPRRVLNAALRWHRMPPLEALDPRLAPLMEKLRITDGRSAAGEELPA